MWYNTIIDSKGYIMGTRSVIGVMHGDVCKAIYCHWDGYYRYNGALLHEYYNDSTKANQLVALGDASLLGVELGHKIDFDARTEYIGDGNPNLEGMDFAKQCKFYGRDLGEDTSWHSFHSYQELLDYYSGAEYFYIMKDGVWYCSESGDTELRFLADVLETV